MKGGRGFFNEDGKKEIIMKKERKKKQINNFIN
jgi:hypothetical protein